MVVVKATSSGNKLIPHHPHHHFLFNEGLDNEIVSLIRKKLKDHESATESDRRVVVSDYDNGWRRTSVSHGMLHQGVELL